MDGQRHVPKHLGRVVELLDAMSGYAKARILVLIQLVESLEFDVGCRELRLARQRELEMIRSGTKNSHQMKSPSLRSGPENLSQLDPALAHSNPNPTLWLWTTAQASALLRSYCVS